MEDYQKSFAKLLADSGALFFAENLSLKDGRPTPYFVNAGKFNTGKRNSELCSNYAEMLVKKGLAYDIDVIFGPSYKGSAIAIGIVNELWKKHKIDIEFEYDRKEAKTHGESSKKESLLVNKTLGNGKNIFIVDDVWTSGATKYEAIDKIHKEAEKQEYNINICGIGIAVDREQIGPVYDELKPKNLSNKKRVILGARGEDAIKSFESKTLIPVFSIAGIRDIVNYLAEEQYPLSINGEKRAIDEQTFDNFQKYMEIYGVQK